MGLLQPTNEELTRAIELGIDPRGKNGPQLREAIARQERHAAFQSTHMKKTQAYSQLQARAMSLGLQLTGHEDTRSLKRLIEVKISELFYEKRIEQGVLITVAGPGKPTQVIVHRVSVHWPSNNPVIMVRVPNSQRPQCMSALTVALNAQVIS